MIELTERAEQAVCGFLDQAGGRFSGLRVGIRDVTCSGVTYALALSEKGEDGDIAIRCGDVAVYVDPRSATLLAGCSVDFIQEGEGGFIITNPNIQSCSSGCPSAGTCAS